MNRLCLTACILALAGCGGGDDETPAKAADRYVGTWNVRYAGQDSGTCALNVAASTSAIYVPFSGSCKSVTGPSVAVAGNIDGAGIVVTNANSAFVLQGGLNGNSGNGTWRVGGFSSSITGTWTATR